MSNDINERELDAQIAEKVMGLKFRLACPSVIADVLREPDQWRPGDDYILLNDDGSFRTGIALPGGPIRLTVPRYATDISAAI